MPRGSSPARNTASHDRVVTPTGVKLSAAAGSANRAAMPYTVPE